MLTGKTTEEKIWNFLLSKLNNEYGVAGLMGNLYAESGLKPTNLQDSFEKKLGMTDSSYTKAVNDGTYEDFITDGAGYGLAQWTYYTRKQNLLEFSIKKNVSIGNLEMQLNFLMEELNTSFKKVLSNLKNAKTVEEASTIVLLEFEKPLDQSAAVKAKRLSYSNNYYNKYHKVAMPAQKSTTQISAPSKKQYKLNIVSAFGINNTNYKADRKPEWIVIHYTAGLSSAKGAALNLANGAKTGGLSTSAEFYVDDETIVQYIQDIPNRYSWSVGGSLYRTLSTSIGGKYYGQCTNQNSINIEICNEKVNKKSYKATDTDWYFTDSAIENAVALTKYLMNIYSIDINHVIMHHAVNGKLCPAMWTYNETALEGWYNFLERVKNAEVTLTSPETSTPNYMSKPAAQQFQSYLIKINVAALNVRNGAGVQYNINTVIKDQNAYTIVEERNGWGRLKSGAGWINLSYTKRV